MGFRGNNSRTFAEYVELEIAVDEYSPNAYLFKRRDSETNKPVSERSWYVGIPIPNKGNGKRLSLGTGQYAFFMGSRNKKVPTSRNKSKKIGLFLSDIEVGV